MKENMSLCDLWCFLASNRQLSCTIVFPVWQDHSQRCVRYWNTLGCLFIYLFFYYSLFILNQVLLVSNSGFHFFINNKTFIFHLVLAFFFILHKLTSKNIHYPCHDYYLNTIAISNILSQMIFFYFFYLLFFYRLSFWIKWKLLN